MSLFTFAQLDELSIPTAEGSGMVPEWGVAEKTDLDSCGAYFNTYVGFQKTSLIFFESLRTGDGVDFNSYPGRGQRYHAPQEIEISGVQFYAFHTNTLVDSLPAIVAVYDYLPLVDSIGEELARDTVWVSHTEISPFLPSIAVQGFFDEPVTVDQDYVVGMFTFTNDSLKIITNDASGDGAGEGVSFAYYNNPFAPSFTGWYNGLSFFGPTYDVDFLIDPMVKYKLRNEFNILNDSICPNVVSAGCVEYNQMPVFSDPHYNRFYDVPLDRIVWNWGDGLQNTALTSLCHTYAESGTYDITLTDSIRRHNVVDLECNFDLVQTITVLDSAVANFTQSSLGFTSDFTSDPGIVDSVFWDFGDGMGTSTDPNPTYVYTDLGTYDVWFYAYGPCNTDSAMTTITISDVGIEDEDDFNSFVIYPNPSNEIVNIKGIKTGTDIELLNIIGETVYRKRNIGENLAINTKDLPQGAYFVRLTNESMQATQKLIVRH